MKPDEYYRKLKIDRRFLLLVIGSIFAIFVVPYVIILVFILWWFYKRSKFSKRIKTITTAIVGILITLLVAGYLIVYSKDAEPHLNIVEPSSIVSVRGQKVAIKGAYEPTDRKVWVNGKEVEASNGNFEYSYELKEGENKIDVSAGNWKRTHTYLTVIRELTEEEKVTKISTPTPATFPQSLIIVTTTPKTLQRSNFYTVSSVIDGDTIKVVIDNQQEALRLIGIDSPETVDPRKPVQCFGKEASVKAKSLLSGKSVRLESDPTQGERDRYQRLLRYVFLEDGTNFNKLMISEGFAHEYTYNVPYKYQAEFKQEQKEAEVNKRGLWAENACSASIQQTTPKKTSGITSESSGTNGEFTCAGKTLCGQMTSCAEAKFYLNTCGISRLDGDKDGVPCESICN